MNTPTQRPEGLHNGLVREARNPSDATAAEYETNSGSDGEEPLDIDHDGVQRMIQPSLSLEQSRLTSLNTPAAEKAAALESLPGGGLFDIMEGAAIREQDTAPSPPGERPRAAPSQKPVTRAQTRQSRGLSLGQLPSGLPHTFRLPSPWNSGPKELVVEAESSSKPALSSVFGQNRHRRSSSGGADTLKRIREALPSISLPSFFSGNSFLDPKRLTFSGDGSSESKQAPPAPDPTPANHLTSTRAPKPRPSRINVDGPVTPRPLSTAPLRPRSIRRSTSDESMLYHSLSRVSSLGDDERWNDIREQKNSRLKAITDSWDRPIFRLPQLPNIIPAPLRTSFLGTETSELSPATPRAATMPETGQMAKETPSTDLDHALESLTGDIVVMGGYRGSILRSTKTNRQVWVPVKVGLNIRKVNLEVGLDPQDEERMEETIYPSGMLKHIGPVDISRRLFKRLRECDNAKNGKLRVWDYGYDWRLSPHLLSRKLISFLEQLPSNQWQDTHGNKGAMVIAHSLGGLITRHAVNQRPELFSGVIYAGTPQKCVNILGPLRNGDAVLFNEKVLTAQVNFSLRTSFALLPDDGFCFINKNTGEEYPVDFFDARDWVKYCWSPCIEPPLPALNARATALGSLRELSGRIPSPLRSRGNSAASESRPPHSPTRNLVAEATRKVEIANDRTLAPQMGTLPGDGNAAQHSRPAEHDWAMRSRNLAYLSRTLAEVKRFRAETQHQAGHTEANAYPPQAIIYGKEIPTVWAAHVSSREAIACSNAYDDLVFRSGDGVVLAREAMLPEGYELVKGGRISTDRGHITMLGDLEAVGRALQAVIRGRRKGIGLGSGDLGENNTKGVANELG